MKTKTLFDDATEVVYGFDRSRPIGDTFPVIPDSVFLVINGDGRDADIYLSGEGSEWFLLGPAVTLDALIVAMASKCGIKNVKFRSDT